MTRPSKTLVAGRVAVASPTQTRVTVADTTTDPVLDSAAQAVTEALTTEVFTDEAAPSGSAAESSQPRRPVSVTEAEREREELALARRIRAHLSKGELSVTLTNNRYTMISVRRENIKSGGKRYKVRLHCMFIGASPAITRALARYVEYNDRDASRLLGDFIDANQYLVRDTGRRSAAPKLTTQGDVHDLEAIYDELNEYYFDSGIVADITWGQKSGKPMRRNSIKMGSYSVEDRLIRIHRSLDRAFVPRFFVEWVVYHEMLHQVHDIKTINGRRQFHSREFLRDEARFERYAEARAWERTHLDALLTF